YGSLLRAASAGLGWGRAPRGRLGAGGVGGGGGGGGCPGPVRLPWGGGVGGCDLGADRIPGGRAVRVEFRRRGAAVRALHAGGYGLGFAPLGARVSLDVPLARLTRRVPRFRGRHPPLGAF